MTLRPERILTNDALAHAECFVADEPSGRRVAVVVARLTWLVSPDGRAEVALEQRPVRLAASYHDDEGRSVCAPSDHVTAKLGTDVLMAGSAHPPPRPPGASPPSAIDVRFRLDAAGRSLVKSVRVHGRRVFVKKLVGVEPGPAASIVEPVPLVYDLAEGGIDPDAEPPKREHPDNPAGRGFGPPGKLVGTEAYRIESLEGAAPAGFGPTGPQWPRRRALYGTTDDRYYRYRYPVAPADYDPRFTSDAHPDLFSPEPLRGDEPVEIVGAVPEGAFRFRLPIYAPRFDVTLDGDERPWPTHLDTFFVDLSDPEARAVVLTWRISVPLPRKSERLQRIRVSNATELPEGFYPALRRRIDAHRQAKENRA